MIPPFASFCVVRSFAVDRFRAPAAPLRFVLAFIARLHPRDRLPGVICRQGAFQTRRRRKVSILVRGPAGALGTGEAPEGGRVEPGRRADTGRSPFSVTRGVGR